MALLLHPITNRAVQTTVYGRDKAWSTVIKDLLRDEPLGVDQMLEEAVVIAEDPSLSQDWLILGHHSKVNPCVISFILSFKYGDDPSQDKNAFLRSGGLAFLSPIVPFTIDRCLTTARDSFTV